MFLLDTNHADKLLKRQSARLRIETLGSGLISLCRPSVGELWFMIYLSRRVEENRRDLLSVLAAWPILEFDASAAEEFGRIMAEQRRKGRRIPPMDAQIAAIARIHSLTILTADKHFDYVDGISVENWLA